MAFKAFYFNGRGTAFLSGSEINRSAEEVKMTCRTALLMWLLVILKISATEGELLLL